MTDVDRGIEVLDKLCKSSWWEWSAGSTLIFWRWHPQDLATARDGMEPFVHSELPTWKPKKLKKPSEPRLSQIVSKLKTIVDRKYVAPGVVNSYTEFFEVPKADDIRMVYNGTSCGLNEALWAPNFWLPYPRSALRLISFDYYSADMDLGEMFLNFPLHQRLQEYSGINLKPFETELQLDPQVSDSYRWTRNWLGARSSPYSSVRFYYWAEEFVRGNHEDVSNELQWDTIVLNLPGDPGYQPSLTRVFKWDSRTGRIAGDLITFVDDGRATGQTLEHTWRILSQVCARFQYFGIQVALRKLYEPKRCPGPWAGAVFETTSSTVTKTTTIEKWNKGKSLVANLWTKLNESEWETTPLFYKELEIARGYLCHLSMTYEELVPHLKGFHLTLASFLNKRDAEGWKHSDKGWKVYLAHQLNKGILDEEEVLRLLEGNPYAGLSPSTILPVPQLKDDCFALQEFFMAESPPKIQERSTNVQIVRYGFGDASGSGFGSTVQTKDGIAYRIGVWGSDDNGESSNFKELENVVSTLEEEACSGNLHQSTMFFFTDNSTVEAALHKGNSSSRKLFELVVRFRKLHFAYGTKIIVSHIAGKRMIEQGTRGNLHEGVGMGKDMLSFVPLHLSALERHPKLEEWLRSWIGDEMEVLTPKGWFTRGHGHDGGEMDDRGFWRVRLRPGVFVWAPPPAAAETAMEELRKSLIKRQDSTHIFVCPRLLTTEWVKPLHKASDLILSIPAGVDVDAWPRPMHEPLTIGFVFPLLHCNPWCRRRTPQMFYMERELLRMFRGEKVASRDFLL